MSIETNSQSIHSERASRALRHTVVIAPILAFLIAFAMQAQAQISFGAPTTLASGTLTARATVVADLDGDFDHDIAVISGSSNAIVIRTNDGLGVFALQGTFMTGVSPRALIGGDFDGDGDVDLAVSNGTSGTVGVYANDGAAGFALVATIVVGAEPRGLSAADVDGDGDLDLAVVESTPGTMTIISNLGGNVFMGTSTVPTGASPRAVAAFDLELDGDLDLVVANANSGSLSIFANDGNAIFTSVASLVAGALPDGVVAADFDLDGDIDLLSSSFLSPTISWFENVSGTFQVAVNQNIGVHVQSLEIGDLDLDGDVDVVAADAALNLAHILRNDGMGAFSLVVSHPTGGFPNQISIADIDGDFVPDVVTANVTTHDLTVLLNTAPVGPALGSAASSRVNGGVLGPQDVLMVNGSVGGVSRRVDVAPLSPITLEVFQPVVNPVSANFVIFGFVGAPRQIDVVGLPFGLGAFSFAPALLDPANPLLFTLTNNFGFDPSALTSSTAAAWTVVFPSLPSGFTFTLQGLILETPGILKATNGLIIRT